MSPSCCAPNASQRPNRDVLKLFHRWLNQSPTANTTPRRTTLTISTGTAVESTSCLTTQERPTSRSSRSASTDSGKFRMLKITLIRLFFSFQQFVLAENRRGESLPPPPLPQHRVFADERKERKRSIGADSVSASGSSRPSARPRQRLAPKVGVG